MSAGHGLKAPGSSQRRPCPAGKGGAGTKGAPFSPSPQQTNRIVSQDTSRVFKKNFDDGPELRLNRHPETSAGEAGLTRISSSFSPLFLKRNPSFFTFFTFEHVGISLGGLVARPQVLQQTSVIEDALVPSASGGKHAAAGGQRLRSCLRSRDDQTM